MDNKIKDYHYNIDFLRILFVLFVVYYHFIRAKYVIGYDLDIYNNLARNARYIGEVCNSALFIISGYFLSNSFVKNISLFKFAFHKLMRFWPVLFFGVCSMFILSIFKLVPFNIGANILNLFCITKVGGGLAMQFNSLTPTWFVCALFWCSLFYFTLYKIINNKYVFNFVLAILIYFNFVIYLNSPLHDYELVGGIFSKGGCYAMANIGVGILIKMFIEEIQNKSFNLNQPIITFIEVGLFCYLIQGFIYRFREELLVVLISFVVLFILFILKQGLLSKFLNNSFSKLIGKYAFSIYIMQTVIFVFFKAFLWKQEHFVINHPILIIFISLIFAIMLGVLTYHLIEEPCAKFLKKKLLDNYDSYIKISGGG